MALNITKLSNAEYTLRDIREAIDGDNAGTSPTDYYTATGNPPGYWIGTAAKLVGGKVGTTASSKTVRSLINERRDPSTGRYLGDLKLTEGDDGQAPVSGWDLTTRQPKSVSILWAFADADTRRRIDECMQRATEMTIAYLEREYATTRAGQGGVASVASDGVMGFVFDHYDTRDGDPQPHKHVVISNRVRRSNDKTWTALDGRKILASAVELSELQENLLQDLLTQELGWTFRPVRDGRTKSMTNEVEGVPQELIDAFSSRDAEITKAMERKVEEYERKNGGPAGWKVRAEIHKEVWLATRKAKPEIQPSLESKRSHWYRKLGDTCPDISIEQVWKDVNSHKSSVIHADAECEDDVARLLLEQLADLTGMAGETDRYLARQSGQALHETAHTRTTWKRTNVRAEAQRLLRDVRIDPEQRIAVTNAIADKALVRCVKLTPTRYRLSDEMMEDLALCSSGDRSVFDDIDLDRYTTDDVLQAEHYMIESLNKPSGIGYKPGEGNAWLDQWNIRSKQAGGYPLSTDQQEAAAYALEDPNLVGAIIGAAGTGKTTTMNAVAQAWQAKYGQGSVLGLATSRKAVGELRQSIGCQSMTIAKLLTINDPERLQDAAQTQGELRQRISQSNNPIERLFLRARLAAQRVRTPIAAVRPNQLIIVDEAGMVDTRNLQWITRLASLVGAKVLLTGDPKQLDSVSGAGGMLGYADRHNACKRLTSLFRFTSKPDRWRNDPDGPDSKRRWEGESDATLRLREGGDKTDPVSVRRCDELIAEYERHDRLHWGEDADLEEEAYRMCIEWQKLGKSTLLIAGTNDQVKDINQRFILERRASGQSESDPSKLLELRDGLTVGAGDQIVCRVNNRDVRCRDGRQIENGMVFSIISTNDGQASCLNLADQSRWTIPAWFLKQGCDGGYASTVHRSQGMTVDRCAAVFPTTTEPSCNLQYVAGTRGKEENHFLYGCKTEEEREEDRMLSGAETDPRKIAESRMKSSLLDHPEPFTATETGEQAYAERYDLKRLIREHDYAAGLIAGPHLLALLAKSHDTKTVEKIERSPSFEWLRGVWSRAYMTDARRATAIISQTLKPRERDIPKDKATGIACRAAKDMLPKTAGRDTFTFSMDADRDRVGLVRSMMEQAGIPFQEEPTMEGEASRFTVDTAHTPAVKALLDAHMQLRDDIDQSMFPEWTALRTISNRAVRNDPDMERKTRPNEPDWAASIAGRLNAGLLDRMNGSVHDDWIGGVLPPIRSSRHTERLDLVRQNERLIEDRTRQLETEARRSGQPWVRTVAKAGRGDGSLLRDVAVYRAMWGIDDPDSPLGEKPDMENRKQEQHWTNLNGRINHTSMVVNPGRNTPDQSLRQANASMDNIMASQPETVDGTTISTSTATETGRHHGLA